ncbi:MAG: 50S ribosomal protein L11 methyltransferase [Gemmatimonadota bacterium]
MTIEEPVVWWALDIIVPQRQRTALAAWLVSHTGMAVEEKDDGTIVSFAAGDPSRGSLSSAIDARFPNASITPHSISPTDWSTSWRRGLGPRGFGRLTVVPSWIPYAPADNEAVVVLDPETAFGSGEHGSTRAALTLLERHLRSGDRMLDLGSGSGILAIAAARLGAASAVGIEVDAEALPIALQNAERNQVGEVTRFLEGDAADLAPLLGPVDMVCSNILRTVNQTLLPAISHSLRPGGKAIFAGMETPEAPLFCPLLEAASFAPVDEVIDGDWWAVLGEKG